MTLDFIVVRVRHSAVAIHNGSIGGAKVVVCLDPVKCPAELPAGDSKLVTDVAGRVA